MTETILVADDDAGLRLTLAANLEEAGYRVLEAEDGARALEVLERSPEVALFISDIRMPVMDGVTAFRRARVLRPDLPVVLMTAFAQEALVQEALSEGVYTLATKPFDPAVLLRVARDALARPAVLVVDDEAEFRDSLCHALRSCGTHAVAAADARSAVEKLEETAIDVAVIDLVLPGTHGAQLCDSLRSARPRLGLVVMTGQDVPDLIRAASKTSSTTTLRKPFDPRQLARIVCGLRGRPR